MMIRVLRYTLLLLLASNVLYAQNYTDNSVLKNGTWYKIAVTEEGIYKITYDDLMDYGVNVDDINPKKISLFGNEAGVLPESNSMPNYDDLSEMSIMVKGEDDTSFDEDDAIIFYGQSPVKWNYSNSLFIHETNYYTDTTFYFLRIDNINDGKRIVECESPNNNAASTITTFQDYQHHEVDMDNYYKQGRLWYGEIISLSNSPERRFSFTFDNVLTTKPAHVLFNLAGSSKVESFYTKIKANEEILFDSIRVNKASSGTYRFGYEVSKKSFFDLKKDVVDIDISILSTSAVSFIGVNYIVLNVWRKLRYENKMLFFSVVNEQFTNDWHELVIENVHDDLLMFDVSSPLDPKRCLYSLENGFAKYQISPEKLSRYVLFEDSDIKDIASMRNVSNQNLHSIRSAEMLIITHPLFIKEAEQIKQIHEQYDGMHSVVVDVNDIYNEFSSGAPDITGIRNFIRMVYVRDNSLKYVLLFGRGTNDYKNILNADNNFVPPYESTEIYSETNSYVSDDYYALMSPPDGDDCEGIVDLGVGRIPVSNKQEAQDAVNKIMAYIESQNRASNLDWRSKILMLADDDVAEYPKNCDKYERVIDTSNCFAVVDKVYTDSYNRTKVANGYEYPEATADLLKKIEEGRLLITYVGHGGVKGLTEEALLRENHIMSLKNIDNMPFVHTGTCEFSKFDNPTYVSAGEKLFLNPHGGAIGMITTTRPTQIGANYTFGLYLYKSLFKDDNIKNITFGDMIKMVKMSCSGSPNYQCYVMFGDPALRLAYPHNDIKLNVVNGNDAEEICVLNPMSEVLVKGEILNDEGKRDGSFNGLIYPTMYDSESDFTTLGNVNPNNVYNFSFFKDVIFKGKAEVVNGEFELSLIIPKSLNYQGNNACLSLMAVDTTNFISATTNYHNFVMDYSTDGAAVDNVGPIIELDWEFTDKKAGVLSASFFDEQGIMHYESYIGRNITITHHSPEGKYTEIVNDIYEQSLNDFTKGYLSMTYDMLTAGDHVFTVKAWDSHENSSEESVIITIEQEMEKSLTNVMNKPNPFKDETKIYFDYSKDDVIFNLTIDIYDVMGRKVNTLIYEDLDNSVRSVSWKSSDSSGINLKAGVYIYKVYIKDSEGDEFVTTQKMIMI